MFPGLHMTIVAGTALIAFGLVPTFDVERSCRHVVVKAAPINRMEACLRDEQNGRDKLRREWAQFPSEAKSECTELEHVAGEPSYVSLLSCLELRRDTLNLQQANEREAAASEGRGGR